MSVIIPAIDLRPMFGPTRDQGPRPTCLAFAVSDLHAAMRGSWKALSCEYSFFHAQMLAQRGPHQGATLSAMLQVIRKVGQPHEEGWPYLPKTPTEISLWKPPSDVGSLFLRATNTCGTLITELIDRLDDRCPVAVLMMLSQSFYLGNEVIRPKPDEQPEASQRHAVVAVGHGSVDGERAFLIRNSWGERWGDGGYSWLTENYLTARIFGAAFLTEELYVPSPSVST